MVGAIAGNLHEGSRSEILADYLFSRWGAVTPVRRQDDYGVDLFCTLTEWVGHREWVREYFTVQVKSTEDPWKFNNSQSVRWLIDYPTPLFLCTVSKKHLRVRIFHVAPRFHVSAFHRDSLPDNLELTLEEGPTGKLVQWVNGSSFSLSAPIVEVGIKEMTDDVRLRTLRDVFAHWVRFETENCDLVRQGLSRFRIPRSYRTNEAPVSAPMSQIGSVRPALELRERGLIRLAEALECIGGWHANQGDFAFALDALLLFDRLQAQYADLFETVRFLTPRVPSATQAIVLSRLNRAIGAAEGGELDTSELYAGLDAIRKMISGDPMVRRYLTAERGAASDAIPISPTDQPPDAK